MSARILRRVALVAGVLGLTCTFPSSAFEILADIDREGNGASGPSEFACTFCPNKSTTVSVTHLQGFPVPADPVSPPGMPINSEIHGIARVDLASGTMRGRAQAASFGNLERHEIRFATVMEEGIDVTLPVGLPASERFITFIGAVHASLAADGVARAESTYSLQVNSVRAAAAGSNSESWRAIDGTTDPRITFFPLADGMRFEMRLAVPSDGEFFIESQLDGTARAEGRRIQGVGIATVNAGNTAQLSMILPAGSTYTSTSGVFLTAPIPEPQTWALMLTGVGVVAAIARRRRSRS